MEILPRKRQNFIINLFQELTQEMGVEFHVEERYGYVCQLTTSDGRKRYFRGTVFDLNGAGSTKIARDKDYAAYFLKRMGYPVPDGDSFHTWEWAEAIESDRTPDRAVEYAKELGFPVIVKPNSKSQGRNVSLANNEDECRQAIERASQNEEVFLIQRLMPGRDYRIVVLDDEVISAYERFALTVIGDGVSTIRQLIEQLKANFKRLHRSSHIHLNDPRLLAMCEQKQLTFDTVLPAGRKEALLPNANLSNGGEAIDVTKILHNDWKTLATKIARDMNLRYIGIDILTPHDLDVSPNDYCIIEINAAPGLDNYAAIGEEQRNRVKDMYRKVLKALLV